MPKCTAANQRKMTANQYHTLEWANVQRQPNGNDCGIFAIAFATALCKGQNPEDQLFDVTQMRQHLHACIEKEKLQPFPSKRRRCQNKTKKVQTVEVYCHCRLAEKKSENMEMCDGCNGWFHNDCEVIPSTAWSDRDYTWYCGLCKHA